MQISRAGRTVVQQNAGACAGERVAFCIASAGIGKIIADFCTIFNGNAAAVANVNRAAEIALHHVSGDISALERQTAAAEYLDSAGCGCLLIGDDRSRTVPE